MLTRQVAVVQNVEITVTNGHYTKRVACMETREGCPITPGSSLTKSYSLTPSIHGNKEDRGIALDGYMKVNFIHFNGKIWNFLDENSNAKRFQFEGRRGFVGH